MIELVEDGGYKWFNYREEDYAQLDKMMELNTSEKEKKLSELIVEEAFLELAGERLSFEEVARYTCNELVIRYLLHKNKKYAKDALKNPECPKWLFENVVNYPDIYDSNFRYVAVHAAKCPKVLLEKMSEDENDDIKKAAKKRLSNMDGKQSFANWLFTGSLGQIILFLMVILSTIGVLCIAFQDAAPSGVQFVIMAVFGLSMILMYAKAMFSAEPERLTGIYW